MSPPAADLRAPGLALVAWGCGLAAFGPRWLSAVLLLLGLVVLLVRRLLGAPLLTLAGWLLAGTAVTLSTWLHLAAVRDSPVRDLARQEATAHGELVVSTDPRITRSRFGAGVWLRATAREVTARGLVVRCRVPVLVLAGKDWSRVAIGARVAFTGRLASPDGADLSAVAMVRGPPRVLSPPPVWQRVAAGARAGVRTAVANQPVGPRSLVPALVDGDDAGLSESTIADFQTSGLTHLVAVSGTNLTLVVGFLLVVARWCGVRARGMVLVGALGVVGFVLLARGEPSVIRAAAMGSVGLIAMGSNGRERGSRALGVAVLALLTWDPWLATTMGFALSSVATAGILFLAPGWRDALCGWVPRWVAEAVAVPLAAQLACTPLVAAISGQVSLVAVAANMMVAAVVGPATVCGLVGGLVAVVWPALGQLVATPAGWCAEWIIVVARRTSDLPVAALTWPSGPGPLVALTAVCVLGGLIAGSVLVRRGTTLLTTAVLVAAMLVRPPTPGWPPAGWTLVMCDVGQGDGVVYNVGEGRAVVVDVGPDADLIDGCLSRLGVREVSVLMLSHFHADHVGGITGVLHGRRVRLVEVTALSQPAGQARRVRAAAARAHARVRVATYGETGSVGPVQWQVLAPDGAPPAASESPPNDASVALYLRSHGITVLTTGDQEELAASRMAADVPGLKVDVLKVAHHGSAKQDPDLLADLDARLALVSVGADNGYGQPAPSTLRLLHRDGMLVRRTDLSGDIAVVAGPPMRVVARGRAP